MAKPGKGAAEMFPA
ncbi:hypothetical protein D4764_17G0008540 [Takifugu flavidus]|uniref:Uncharacterized protein n=1 Tax=Takifugu flavidus TaxID=433684 RepID=A0A5C6NXM9_9TELE|nr:hypothetical protein D4764_17G0008540 [Takifugu flavidus]